MVNRIKANHYNLNESLYRKNMCDYENCECGYEEQDINHLVFVCRKYEREREDLGK